MHMKTTAAKKSAPRAKSRKRAIAKPASANGRGALVAKVFQSGNSQAIRIPAAVKLSADAYIVEATDGGGLRLIDPAYEARRLKALRELWGSAPDFPDHTT
jgi:virulence-associated protein VagC